MKAKVKRHEVALDRDNDRVDRILKDIPDLKSLGRAQLQQLLSTEAGQVKLGFKVSPEEFEPIKRRLEVTNTIIHMKKS